MSHLRDLLFVVTLIATFSANDGQYTRHVRTWDEMAREVAILTLQMEKLMNTNAAVEGGSSGTTYIRWGRHSCENDARVLYRGYSAGPLFIKTGGGGNYLCLHDTPQWSSPQPGVAEWASKIYGVQYEVSNVFSTRNNGNVGLVDQPAACAMCYVPSRSTTVMIPARTECPTGWTREYGGFIVADHVNYHRTEYVCSDEAPDITTGARLQDQSLFYQVEVMCGSLPCSLFPNGHELTCVVCSK